MKRILVAVMLLSLSGCGADGPSRHIRYGYRFISGVQLIGCRFGVWMENKSMRLNGQPRKMIWTKYYHGYDVGPIYIGHTTIVRGNLTRTAR